MIELQMVYRMAKRGAILAPLVVAPFLIWGGPDAGISAAIGIAMALLNLLLSARIIGGVAENSPKLLLPAAMAAFMLGLGVLTAIAFGLEALDFVTFKVTGLVLIGSHLGLVLWEAARAYPVKNTSPANDASRSSRRAAEHSDTRS
ncbi:MAG: hypothetical protein GEU71_05815 [Actinobacteria bacterium]|nr:hypothetical protein [Actinomycetota bacterium]